MFVYAATGFIGAMGVLLVGKISVAPVGLMGPPLAVTTTVHRTGNTPTGGTAVGTGVSLRVGTAGAPSAATGELKAVVARTGVSTLRTVASEALGGAFTALSEKHGFVVVPEARRSLLVVDGPSVVAS